MKSRVNALSKGVDRNKLYCSDGCKSECPVFNKHSNVISTKQNTSREVNTYLRQLVLKRDGYKCIKCKSEERLHCHHILPLNESPIESADVDNCIALCKVCHKKIHMTVGCKYNELKCN
jgi:5-methylcytosine-specific restriction endonuclease McrA